MDRALWKGQRPFFEIWFAVILDASRRRALWVRETLFVPRQGDGRTTVWGAWFDADGRPNARAAKRYFPIERAKLGEGAELIRIEDTWLGRDGAQGAVERIAWDVKWHSGRPMPAELPTWLPAPTHASMITYDAEATGKVVIDGRSVELAGRASAMHLWGKKHVPTLQWIWAPWMPRGVWRNTPRHSMTMT